jgi:type IV pilus assembly protein PilM
MCFSFKPQAFGLDISDFSLKIAALKKNKKGDLKLTSFGTTVIPFGIIEKGEIKDEEKLSEIIKKTLKQIKGEKIRTKYVIASLPEEKSFLNRIRLPIMEQKEIEGAIRFEIENYIPFSLEKVYFDFEKIQSDNKNYQEILIGALPKDIAESYSRVFKKAGLQPLALEPECLSISRALIKKNKIIDSILIIDMGKTRTTFIFFFKNNIKLVSTVPFSSQELTKALSEEMKISLDEAEKIKCEEGLTGKEEISKILISLLIDFVKKTEELLEYYNFHQDENSHAIKPAEKILLCGGGANIKGIEDFLNAQFKIKVILGNPWNNILKTPLEQIPEISLEESLGYASALGLALRGILA